MPDFMRYRLGPLRSPYEADPLWVFQVPPEIIPDHNDIFNSRSVQLIMSLIQISGAVVSLAEDWERNFEPHT